MSKDFAPVKTAINGLGGEVVGFVWLNRTILAKVPAYQIRELANIDNVHLIDLPHSLQIGQAH
jgi:hypothetical protein